MSASASPSIFSALRTALSSIVAHLSSIAVRREARATVVLALPLIASQLSSMGMNLIDVLLAGHLGPQVLAPVAVGTSIWMLVMVCLNGMLMALPASVAQLDGANRRDEVWPLFRQALWLAVTLGALLVFVEGVIGPRLIAAIGVAPALLADATRFLHVICFGAPALGIFFACRGFSEGLSMTRPSLLFGLLGPALLAPIGYALMYGKFGLPALGVVGSGLATAIVLWCQALAFLTFVFCSSRYRTLRQSGGNHWPDRRVILGLCRIGGPMSVTLLMEAGIFIATSLVIGRLGETAVATHQIAFSVASLTFMVPLGLSMAITVRVAHAKGRGDPPGIRRAGFVGIGMALGVQMVASGLMLTIPAVIVGFYTRDPHVIASAIVLLRLAGLFQISDGVQVASNGALRGLKDTRMPMFITMFAYWMIGMPIGIYLSIYLGYGAAGMWIGLVAGLTVAAVLLFSRFVRASRLGHAATASPTVSMPLK